MCKPVNNEHTHNSSTPTHGGASTLSTIYVTPTPLRHPDTGPSVGSPAHIGPTSATTMLGADRTHTDRFGLSKPWRPASQPNALPALLRVDRQSEELLHQHGSFVQSLFPPPHPPLPNLTQEGQKPPTLQHSAWRQTPIPSSLQPPLTSKGAPHPAEGAIPQVPAMTPQRPDVEPLRSHATPDARPARLVAEDTRPSRVSI